MAGQELKRFRELDALRGVAALVVVAFHYTVLFDEFFAGHEASPVTVPWGHYGVELFFLISGFVILMTARRKDRPGSFLYARFIRLYPPYWVCLGLSVGIVAVLGVEQLRQPPWVVAVNVTMLQKFLRVREVDGAYWSLAAELLFYALVVVLLLVFRRLSARVVLATCWAWLAVSACILLSPFADSTVSFMLLPEFSAFFGMGMVLYLARLGEVRWWMVTLIGVAGIGVAFLAAGLSHAGMTLLLMGGFAVVTQRRSTVFLTWRPLLWLGAVSYPLYLLHQNIGYAVIQQTEPVVGRVASMALALILVLALSHLVHVLVEVRFTRWFTTRTRPRIGLTSGPGNTVNPLPPPDGGGRGLLHPHSD